VLIGIRARMASAAWWITPLAAESTAIFDQPPTMSGKAPDFTSS
jgi:hypothetical protein